MIAEILWLIKDSLQRAERSAAKFRQKDKKAAAAAKADPFEIGPAVCYI